MTKITNTRTRSRETGKIIAEDNYYVNQNKNNYYLSAVYGKLLADDWRLRVGYHRVFQG